MVEALLSLVTVIVCCVVIWFFLKWLLRPVRRLYYAGKSVFRGKYFHRHYVDEDGHLQIVYRTDFGLRFWTLMGRVYSFCVFVIPLFFLMVRLDGTEGYALAESSYFPGDEIMYYDISERCSGTGIYVSSDSGLIIENNTGETLEVSGFVIGRYYHETVRAMDIPGLFVRSTASNVRVLVYYVADKLL